MTQATARLVANTVLTFAGAAAVYLVLTKRPLRRAAKAAARRWLGAAVPAYLLGEMRRAWAESARPA